MIAIYSVFVQKIFDEGENAKTTLERKVAFYKFYLYLQVLPVNIGIFP